MFIDEDVLGLAAIRGVRRVVILVNKMIIIMRIVDSKLVVIFGSRIIVWVMTEIDMVIMRFIFLWGIINAGSSIVRRWQLLVCLVLSLTQKRNNWFVIVKNLIKTGLVAD